MAEPHSTSARARPARWKMAYAKSHATWRLTRRRVRNFCFRSAAGAWSCATLTVLLVVALFGMGLSAPATTPAPAAPVVSRAPVMPDAPRPLEVLEGALESGQTLSARLRDDGVPPAAVEEIERAMRPVFDFRYARPGDSYWLGRNAHGVPMLFRYARTDVERYELRREGGALVALSFEPEAIVREARLDGVINSNLHDAVKALGERPELALDFAQIFAWDVDFERTRAGETFSIWYERRFQVKDRRERYLGPGRILAARYTNAEGEFDALYFKESNARRGSYFRRDGTSVERQFLRAPLQYRRISSRYSLSRFHPVMKVRRAHPAIDYAAPRGTPVWSVADGHIIFRGANGWLGNTVKVRHPNGFETYYGHLSRFAKEQRVGAPVKQQQVIGYVGSTGISTGPHLDYRMKRAGRFVNPDTVETPRGKPIDAAHMAAFRASWDRHFTRLAPGPLRFAARQEAF